VSISLRAREGLRECSHRPILQALQGISGRMNSCPVERDVSPEPAQEGADGMKSSRRNFLLTAAAAPLAARLGGWWEGGFESLAALLPAGGQMQFENPQMIRYDAKCFT